MKSGWIAIVLVVVLVLAVLALGVGGMYVARRNQMVTKSQAVEAQWHQVDVDLQRRADLIPNLVETVKGYAAQEQTVFGDIAKARSALLSAQSPSERIAANAQLEGSLGRLLAVVLNYPHPKTNHNSPPPPTHHPPIHNPPPLEPHPSTPP